MEELRVQFGPLVVEDRTVMLLAVVVDQHGRRRALDFLEGGTLPHLTIGKLKDGGGWVSKGGHCLRVEWDVAGPPREVPDRPTLEWSQTSLFSMPVSDLMREIGGSDVLAEASRSTLGVHLWVDHEHHRFTLVGGPALAVYREIQARVVSHVRSMDSSPNVFGFCDGCLMWLLWKTSFWGSLGSGF